MVPPGVALPFTSHTFSSHIFHCTATTTSPCALVLGRNHGTLASMGQIYSNVHGVCLGSETLNSFIYSGLPSRSYEGIFSW